MKRIGKKGVPYGLTKKEAQEKLKNETFKRKTVSLYKYVSITNPQEMRDTLFNIWERLDCLGRIYLAHEGINAQMSVPEHGWDEFVSTLYAIPEFTDVPLKIGIHHATSFYKLQVKVRPQIVADGLTMEDYDIENVGNHLTAAEFNAAMEEDGSIVVDMRNHYESEIGHFDGALTPQVDTFREELPNVAQQLEGQEDKKLLLYCTGGIRCEKASAYLKDKGFKDVNQLHGGIIDYKHQVDKEGLKNKFLGSNYVFDQREPEKIGQKIISQCHQCDESNDRHVNCANEVCNLLFLQCNTCELKMSRTCSLDCKRVMYFSEEKRQKYYLRKRNNGIPSFSKSLDARERFIKKTPWQKIKNIFV